MNGIWLVFKKEMLELSKDRKTLFFTFAMPFLIYPLLFGMMSKMGKTDEARRRNKPSRVHLVDAQGILMPLLQGDPKNFDLVPAPAGDLRKAIRDQQLELAVEVEPEAAAKLARQETFSAKVLYDKSEDASKLALDRLKTVMRAQDQTWIQARLKLLGASAQLAVPSRLETQDAGDFGRFMGKVMGAFLPYILMLMMFAGSMQHGIYATAGEKERGTLQTLLSTALPRLHIILGKILYVFAVGLVVAVMNLASMAVSMTWLFASNKVAAGASTDGAGLGALSALADPTTLLLAFLLMIPLGLVFSNIIVLLGIQAKNSQEAGTALMPAMLVVIFMGVFSIAPGIEKLAWLPYAPIVNVSLAIRKMLGQQANALEYVIALLMTLGLATFLTWLSTRILQREATLFKGS